MLSSGYNISYLLFELVSPTNYSCVRGLSQSSDNVPNSTATVWEDAGSVVLGNIFLNESIGQ